MKLRLKKVQQILKKLGAFTIFALLAWLLLFAGIAFMAFRGRYRDEVSSISQEMDIASMQTGIRFREYLSDIEIRFACVAEGVKEKALENATDEQIQDYFSRSTESMNGFDEDSAFDFYGVVNEKAFDGLEWFPEEEKYWEDRPWYTVALEGEGRRMYSMPYIDKRTGNYVVTISQELSDGDVLALDINIDLIHRMTREDMPDDAHKTVIVLDQNGIVVAHTDRDKIGINYGEETDNLDAKIYETWTKNQDKGLPAIFLYGKHTYIVGAYKINDLWTALTVMDADSRINELFVFLRNAFGFSILGSILMIVTLVTIASGKIKADELYENLITLSNSYLSMHVIDLEFDTFQEINCTDTRLKGSIGRSGDHANETLKKVAQSFCAERSVDAVLAFVDLKTLPERLWDEDYITIEFLSKEQHWMRGRFIVAERQKDRRAKSVIWSVRSIDTEKREQDRLQYLADTDNLTGILNRGSGEARISERINEMEGIFILLDVDHFKTINDKYGHRTGDKVLIAVANSLKNSFRENDIVMRLGGDEFVAFAGKVGTKEGADRIIRRLFDNISKIQISGAPYLQVNISVGVTYSNPDARPLFKDIYKRADAGTYESKKTLGNMVTYDDSFPA